MEWYGTQCLEPKFTKKLMKKWQSPAGNSAEHYYDLFPHLYPYYLPDDHYIVKYTIANYPKNRDYRTFKSAPKNIKSTHSIEWEDGYGPCNVCDECISAKSRNDAQMTEYYKRLKEWRDNGTPM